jgi:hypothetical protein
MENYYMTRPGAKPAVSSTVSPHTNAGLPAPSQGDVLSEFDRFRLGRVTRDSEEGWASELRRYLKDLPADVTKDTDIVKWWQVWLSSCSFSIVYCIDLSYI